MNNFLPVFRFHLKEGFSSKSFKITAFVIFGIILGFFAFFHFSGEENKLEISLINETEQYALDENTLNETYDFANFDTVQHKDLEKNKDLLIDGELDAVVLVTEENGEPSIDYYYKRFNSVELMAVIQQELQARYAMKVGTENDISLDVMGSLFKPVEVNNIVLEENNSAGLIYFFSYIIFIFIIMYGQMVAMGVVGEKTTRVMEIMVTKVHPITMMYAKVFSSLLVGLAQIVIVFLAYLTAKMLGWTGSGDLNIFGMPIDLSALTLENILFLITYFILGYVLYAMLFASISSVVSRAEDVSSVLFPISMLIMVGFFLTFQAMFNPSSMLVVVGSYIPFFSPVVMPSLLLSGEADWVNILGSIGVLLVTILLLSYFANRIYLNGVMNYKNKVSFKDVIKMAKRR